MDSTRFWMVVIFMLASVVIVAIGSYQTGRRDARREADQNGIFVNVQDFGAKGDGKTDDADAVNRALASMTHGGTLYFPRGTYRLDVQIGVRIKDGGDWVITDLKMSHPR